VTPIRGTDVPLLPQAQWSNKGTRVAAGNAMGEGFHQLNVPLGLYVDDNETIYVADSNNHRVVAWSAGKTSGQVVAGGNSQGSALNQLNQPTDVISDRSMKNLLICDSGNARVMRWLYLVGVRGEILLSNIRCFGLTMDARGFLYVSVMDKYEVRRFKLGESEGTLVAGGNDRGQGLDQLDGPMYLFVDRDHSVYVSDYNNHRVVKWVEGAKQGELVAGGHGQGNNMQQLFNPTGVLVDVMGTVYVADRDNNRVMRWPRGSTEGNVVVGEMGEGGNSNQLTFPQGLAFGPYGHLYVVDGVNSRVQRFDYLGMCISFFLQRFLNGIYSVTFLSKFQFNFVSRSHSSVVNMLPS
jgi:sugar lactone lactonase YvrE